MVKIPLSGFSHCFQLCLNPRKQKESQAIFMKTVYADNAATTALCPEALDAMVDCLKNNYGNASSLHHMGQEAADYLEELVDAMIEKIGEEGYEQWAARKIFPERR